MESLGRTVGGTVIMVAGILGVIAGSETYDNAQEMRNRERNIVATTFDGVGDAFTVVGDIGKDYYNQARQLPNNGPTTVPGEAIVGIAEVTGGLAVTALGGFIAYTGWGNRRRRSGI